MDAFVDANREHCLLVTDSGLHPEILGNVDREVAMCLTDVRSLRGARLIARAQRDYAITGSIVLGIARPAGEQEFIEVLQWSEHLPFKYVTLSPSKLELWLLRDAPTSVAESSQSGSSVTQFVHEWTENAPQGSPRSKTRKRQKYDAIGAQRNESLFSGPSTLQAAIDELERKSLTLDPTSFAAIDLRRAFSALRTNLDRWTGRIDCATLAMVRRRAFGGAPKPLASSHALHRSNHRTPIWAGVNSIGSNLRITPPCVQNPAASR